MGFSIQPSARELIERSEQGLGIAATYVQMTPDVMVGDLLKNMRSSQIFSACGLPEIVVSKDPIKTKSDPQRWRVEGNRRIAPITMELGPSQGRRRACPVPGYGLQRPLLPRRPGVLPAYGGLGQPQAVAQDHVRGRVWDHLAGSTSAPFTPGEHPQGGGVGDR